MLREVASVFPGVDVEGVAVVPTCQRARVDLVRTGEEPEGEKERLLEQVQGLCVYGMVGALSLCVMRACVSLSLCS
jgi:hypothetical protein